jgi:predicted permease
MRIISEDLRYALRQLSRSPGFALTTIGILALGIGAVISVFSVVYAVLLNPFAYRAPDQLVVLHETVQELRSRYPILPDNYLHYLHLKSTSRTVEDIAIFRNGSASVAIHGDRPQIVGSMEVSPNFFPLLGIQPILGRSFTTGEADPGRHSDVVLLSYSAWQRLFHGDPSVIGSTITDAGTPKSIVGVLPKDFQFPQIAIGADTSSGLSSNVKAYEVFKPLVPNESELTDEFSHYNFLVLARLKPGITPAEAQAELDGLQKAHTLAAHLPIHLGIVVQSFTQSVTGRVSPALWLLFASVGSVLLIACVNLANLQLARAVSREHELAVRAALGADRWRLVRSRLMESLVLAVLGGAIGVLLAEAGIRLFVNLAPVTVPRIHEVHINWMLLLFAAGLSIMATVFFGILPALWSLRVQPQQALQNTTTRTANTRTGLLTRNLFVCFEVASTVVLLITTALIIRSFDRILNQNRGVDTSHVVLTQVELVQPRYQGSNEGANARIVSFTEQVLDGLSHIPGVDSVAMTSAVPFTGDTWVAAVNRPDNPLPPREAPNANVRWISPGYCSLMHMRIVAGRDLTGEDKEYPNNILVSEKAARDIWNKTNPLGKQIRSFDGSGSTMTVVGVVADTRVNSLRSVAPIIYVPFWNVPPRHISFLLRSGLPANTLTASIRREIWNADPEIAITMMRSMEEQVEDSVALERFQTLLLSCFAGAALLLVLVGVYGVLSYFVTLRTHELTIRVAIGADRANIVSLVLWQALLPVCGGLLLGLLGSMMAARAIQSELFETKAADPLAVSASVVLLLLTALLAAALPAFRAARVHPMTLLRAN